MDLLLAHWHCILPLVAIPILLIASARSDSKKSREESQQSSLDDYEV